MKKKGINKKIIVVIAVVAIAVVGGLAYYFLTREEKGPGGLPLYPGGGVSEIDIEAILAAAAEPIPTGIEAKFYGVTTSTSNVLAWYGTKMVAEGWVKMSDLSEETYEYDGMTTTLEGISYMKGDKVAVVMTLELGDSIFLGLLHGSITAWGIS